MQDARSGYAGEPMHQYRPLATGKVLHIRSALAALALAMGLASSGCGHSEDEMQALMLENAKLRASCATQPSATTAPASAAPRATPGGCAQDSDCKGNSVCEHGMCVLSR